MNFATLWRTIIAWPVGILLTLVMIPPGLIALALDPVKKRLVQPIVGFWGRVMLRLCFIQVRVIGGESIKDLQSVVFAANHQSLTDIFLMIGFLPKRASFLAKKQTLWIPVIGLLILLLGHILVDRSNPRKSLRSVEKCIRAVKNGRSIIIFPEGTRTRDGRMQRFKGGSLKIPVRTGAPVVPVTICGSFNVMPRNTFSIRPYPIVLHIGEPIETSEVERSNFRAFVSRVEGVIRETKERLEREYPDAAPATRQTLSA